MCVLRLESGRRWDQLLQNISEMRRKHSLQMRCECSASMDNPDYQVWVFRLSLYFLSQSLSPPFLSVPLFPPCPAPSLQYQYELLVLCS